MHILTIRTGRERRGGVHCHYQPHSQVVAGNLLQPHATQSALQRFEALAPLQCARKARREVGRWRRASARGGLRMLDLQATKDE